MNSKRKSNDLGDVTQSVKKKNKMDEIGLFWEENYSYKSKDLYKLEITAVYSILTKVYPGTGIKSQTFFDHSCTMNVKTKRNCKRNCKRKPTHFYDAPVSEAAILHHNASTNIPCIVNHGQCRFHLASIQRLISDKKNNCSDIQFTTTQ